MSRLPSSSRVLLPLLAGAFAFALGCTFEPPDSVIGTGGSQGEDGSGNGGGTGGGGGNGGGGADAGPTQGVSTQTLTVTYTTEPVAIAPGAYAPANALATWIEDSNGEFVATIDRKAANFKNRLVAWAGQAGLDDTDAVSGASRSDHNGIVEVVWAIPADLADGTYTIRMETADGNSVSADENAQGTFTFEKDGVSLVQPAVTANGYIDVVIDYAAAP